MTKTITALTLLAIGYLAGAVLPAYASDPAQGIVTELRGIKQELQSIRRALEKK